jgi:hypothetical protein
VAWLYHLLSVLTAGIKPHSSSVCQMVTWFLACYSNHISVKSLFSKLAYSLTLCCMVLKKSSVVMLSIPLPLSCYAVTVLKLMSPYSCTESCVFEKQDWDKLALAPLLPMPACSSQTEIPSHFLLVTYYMYVSVHGIWSIAWCCFFSQLASLVI